MMPLSSSTSLSAVHTMDSDVPSPRLADTTTPTRAAADGSDDTDDDSEGGERPAAARITSCFRSQKSLVALCKKLGVDTKEFTPLLAGERRACSPPPAGAICVYEDALEAGMRFPLHPFFCEVLSHFGIAPSQLAPSGWRLMVGFVALSRSAAGGQPPSVSVFRHFFALCTFQIRGWYCFRKKEVAGVLFTGLWQSVRRWKEEFFFLQSREPWTCPVRWGEPTKNAVAEPGLTDGEKAVAARLLRARGAAPIDLRIYLTESNIAAATRIVARAPLPSPSRRATDAEGTDPSTYAKMMQDVRAGKTAVKGEPGNGDAPDSDWTLSLSGKKTRLVEENADQDGGLRRCSELMNARGSVSGACASAPPGFHMHPAGHQKFQTPKPMPDLHDGDDTADWEEPRRLLQSIVTPSRKRAFAAAKPCDVIDSTYTAVLQATNYASFSLDYARRLCGELEQAKAELADARRTAAAEVERAKVAAVQEFLGSEEHQRRLEEEYERGAEDMKRVALALRPGIDAARMVVTPGGLHWGSRSAIHLPFATDLHCTCSDWVTSIRSEETENKVLDNFFSVVLNCRQCFVVKLESGRTCKLDSGGNIYGLRFSAIFLSY